MTSGVVSNDQEIVIELEVVSPGQTRIPIRAVMDTGFNGFLTLPAATLQRAGAISVGKRDAELGDGQLVGVELFLVQIIWLGGVREILAVQAEATPLLGMSLLWDTRVSFEAKYGGVVEIEPLP